MKKLTLISMVLLLGIALLASVANAQLTVSSPALGSKSAQAETNVSASVTVTNTGTVTVNSIAVSSTAGSQYLIGFSGAPTSLAPGASATFTMSGFLSKDLSAVDNNLAENPITIGTIVVNGNNGTATSTSAPITAQVENELEIKDVIITVNGETDHNLEDGDDLKDLKPGDKLSIKVNLENNFDEDDDVDIEDIDVAIELDSDFDTGDDSDTIDSISANDDDSIDFNDITIEDEASGSYTLEITARGHRDDATGSIHGEKIKIDLKVERESHEIAIRSASLSPTTLACGVTTFNAKVSAVNIGKSNEDEVAVEVSIPALSIVERKENIEVDKSDEFSRTIPVSIPANTKPGTYNVELRTFWDTELESDMHTIPLKVTDCTTTTTTPVVTPPTTTTPVVTTPVVTSHASSTSSFWDTGLGITTLIAGIIIALAIIGLLIAMLVRGGSAE
jgi:hypothetical protein